MGLKPTTMERNRKKLVKNPKKMLGEGEEENAPLKLTQGLGEDKTSESDGNDEEEIEIPKKGKKASVVDPSKRQL